MATHHHQQQQLQQQETLMMFARQRLTKNYSTATISRFVAMLVNVSIVNCLVFMDHRVTGLYDIERDFSKKIDS